MYLTMYLLYIVLLTHVHKNTHTCTLLHGLLGTRHTPPPTHAALMHGTVSSAPVEFVATNNRFVATAPEPITEDEEEEEEGEEE